MVGLKRLIAENSFFSFYIFIFRKEISRKEKFVDKSSNKMRYNILYVLVNVFGVTFGYYFYPQAFTPRFVLQQLKHRDHDPPQYASIEQMGSVLEDFILNMTTETSVSSLEEVEATYLPEIIGEQNINGKLDMPIESSVEPEVSVTNTYSVDRCKWDVRNCLNHTNTQQVFSTDTKQKTKRRKTKKSHQFNGPKVVLGTAIPPVAANKGQNQGHKSVYVGKVSAPISVFSEYDLRRSKRSLDDNLNATGSAEVNSTIGPLEQAPYPIGHNNKIDFDDDEYYLEYDDFSYEEDFDDRHGHRPVIVSSGHDADLSGLQNLKQTLTTEENEENENYEDEPGIFDYVSGFFSAIGSAVGSILQYTNIPKYVQQNNDDSSEDDEESSAKIDLRRPKYPHHIQNEDSSEVVGNDDDDKGVLLGKWFRSWFKDNLGTKWMSSWFEKKDEAGTNQKGWFSWFNGEDDKNPENESEDNEWFFDWFGSVATTATKRATTTAAVPILTISDPLKNPQNWIGILAQHIINSTPLASTPTTTTTTTATAPIIERNDVVRVVSYSKHQIWRLKPRNTEQVEALENYKTNRDGAKLQWLKGPSLRGYTDVLVSPKMTNNLQETLSSEGVDYEVLVFDLGKAIEYENAKNNDNETLKLLNKSGYPFTWQKYYRYYEIVNFVEYLQVQHPNIVKLLHIGRSYEGKPLVIVKIEKMRSPQTKIKNPKQRTKVRRNPAVFIEAGAHGREWIGPAAATWIIKELIKIMKSNGTSPEEEIIRKTTWFIMPVLNPDGYDYTHDYDRMWRKTRSRHKPLPKGFIDSALNWLQQKPQKKSKMCYGVDPNCNWEYNWGQKGSSKSPCNEFYAGPNVFSELETRAASKFLMDHRKHIKVFIALHSYGQIISYPRKENSVYNMQNFDDLTEMAAAGAEALRNAASTTRYRIDSENNLLAKKSGSSDYFAIYEGGIPYSFTLHLGDKGAHGYLLPASYIEATSRDAFEIIKSMVDFL